MGKKKIKIEFIEKNRDRMRSYRSREKGLMKKAHEIGVLCNLEVAVLFSDLERNMHFYSNNQNMKIKLKTAYSRTNGGNKPKLFTYQPQDYPFEQSVIKNKKGLHESLTDILEENKKFKDASIMTQEISSFYEIEGPFKESKSQFEMFEGLKGHLNSYQPCCDSLTQTSSRLSENLTIRSLYKKDMGGLIEISPTLSSRIENISSKPLSQTPDFQKKLELFDSFTTYYTINDGFKHSDEIMLLTYFVHAYLTGVPSYIAQNLRLISLSEFEKVIDLSPEGIINPSLSCDFLCFTDDTKSQFTFNSFSFKSPQKNQSDSSRIGSNSGLENALEEKMFERIRKLIEMFASVLFGSITPNEEFSILEALEDMGTPEKCLSYMNRMTSIRTKQNLALYGLVSKLEQKYKPEEDRIINIQGKKFIDIYDPRNGIDDKLKVSILSVVAKTMVDELCGWGWCCTAFLDNWKQNCKTKLSR